MKKKKEKMLRSKAIRYAILATGIFFGLVGLGFYSDMWEIIGAILTGFSVLLLFTSWIIMAYLYFKSNF